MSVGTEHQTFATRWEAIWDRIWPETDKKSSWRERAVTIVLAAVWGFLVAEFGWYAVGYIVGLFFVGLLGRWPEKIPWTVRLTAGALSAAITLFMVHLLS